MTPDWLAISQGISAFCFGYPFVMAWYWMSGGILFRLLRERHEPLPDAPSSKSTQTQDKNETKTEEEDDQKQDEKATAADEKDDKIIAVMAGDFIYEKYKDLKQCPENVIERLRHYFLTYKDSPERINSRVQITHTYGVEEAHQVIRLSQEDYAAEFSK